MMLVDFLIDAHQDSWVMMADSQNPDGDIKNLIREWELNGILRFVNKTTEDELHERLIESPQGIRKRLKLILAPRLVPQSALPRVSREYLDAPPADEFSWSHVQNQPDLQSGIQGRYLVIVGNSMRGNDLGINEGQNGGIEIQIMRYAGESQYFQQCKEISQKQIQIGESVDEIWDQRFANLARHSDRVVVGDAYAFSEHNKNVAITKDSITKHGLFRLIANLDESSNKRKTFTLFTTLGLQPFENVLGLLYEHKSRLFSGGGLKKIIVKELHRPEMNDDSHGRFIRFDSSWIDVDLGLEIFSGTLAQRASSFSTKLFKDDLKLREQNLHTNTINTFELSPTGFSKL